MTNLLHEKERDYKDRISKKFMVILNYYFEDYFSQNPEEASELGLNRYDNLLKDYSDEAYEKELNLNLEIQKKLKFINPYNLTLDEHADYLLLSSRVNRFIFDHENLPEHRRVRPDHYLPLKGVYTLLFRTMKDADRLTAVTSRLSTVPRLIDQAKKNLKNPPALWTNVTINRLNSVKNFIKNIPDIDIIKQAASNNAALGNGLVDATIKALEALDDYDRFLNVELIEKAHGEFCIGRQAFDFYLTNDHFLTYTSGYLNELGYELFSKTISDLNALAIQIDKNKSFESLVMELESHYTPAEKLLETYKQTTNRTKEFVIDNQVVSLPENETIKVIETPNYFREIIPFAAYHCLGPYEPSNTGHFWVTPVTEEDEEKKRQLLMDGHNLYRIPVTVLHEAYPGHHLQLMTAKKVLFGDDISTMRRATHNTIFIEGWAMYCEQMMSELAFFSDQQKLLMLKNRLWRAARVIIDTELHTGRRSFDESIAFLVNKLNMSEKHARAEVIRYTLTPTQPLSYELGRRLINQLRDKEKIKLRENFSLKEFHDKLLSKGSLPVKLIEELTFHQKIEVMR